MQIGKSTKQARHSTSGLPSVGLQQCGNSTDQTPKLGMFRGRSSSSRAFDPIMAAEEQASEQKQARPGGAPPRGLEPSSYHRGIIINPLSELATPSEFPRTNSSKTTPGGINSGIPGGGTAAIPAISEPLIGPTLPDTSLPSRRPSLVRASSANSTSAALWSHSGLPRITIPSSTTYTTAAAIASSSPPHPLPSPSAQQPQGPPSIFPAPPASPKHPAQTPSLGARRHLPSPITSPGAGSPVTASQSAAAIPMTRNGGSFRSRLLNIRDAPSPSSSITSASGALERRQSNLEFAEDAGTATSQLRSHLTSYPHQQTHQYHHQQQQQQPNACLLTSFDEEDEERQFTSAEAKSPSGLNHAVSSPLPLPGTTGSSTFERPSSKASSTPFETAVAAVAAGATTPPSTMLQGQSFRRPAFPRSVSLEPPRFDSSSAANADDWIDGIGSGGGAAAAAAGISSVNSRSSSQALPSVAVIPNGSDCTAVRRSQSDWVFGVREDGDGGGEGNGSGGAANTNNAHLGGTAPIIQSSMMEPSYRNAGRRAYKSSSGMGLYGRSLLDIRTADLEDADRSGHKLTSTGPGCVSRLRLFHKKNVLLDFREEDEKNEDDESDINTDDVSEGRDDTDSGVTGMEIQNLDQILDPMLDVLDPGRKVARRCMQRLQNGAAGISRPRAVESWADGETGLLENGFQGGGRGGGGASKASSDGSAAHAPVLATLATQVLKLPCVGLEKLNDPEKRQKVVQRLREAADVGSFKFTQILANNRVINNGRWQP